MVNRAVPRYAGAQVCFPTTLLAAGCQLETIPGGSISEMSWKGGGGRDAGLGCGHPLTVGRPLDGAGREEVAGSRVVPVPVHVVREVLALALVLALGGAGEEGGDPGVVRDDVVLAAGAIVRSTAVGQLGWHCKPDSQDAEKDGGKEKTHFVAVVALLILD